MNNKIQANNINDLQHKIALLQQQLKQAKSENETTNEAVESEATDEFDIDSEPETDEDASEVENFDENATEQYDTLNNENKQESYDDAEDSELPEISEKLDKLISDFTKFKTYTTRMLEAIMASQRISIGIKSTETPVLKKEKKALGTLNTASGKLKKEVQAIWLKMDSDGVLHVTNKDVTITKATACEDRLEIEGKIPDGDWIVVERKEKYYLVSIDNFDEAEDVTSYDSYDEEDNETSTQGILVNKKGVANNVRGYLLKPRDDDFELTKKNLERPRKVFDAKWSKSECDYEVNGEPLPEGTWVVVYNSDDEEYFLVSSDDVEPKVSTEKKEKKSIKKKVASKK